jgi:hypothetical protein
MPTPVVPNGFCQIPSDAAKRVKIAGMEIAAERLLNLKRRIHVVWLVLDPPMATHRYHPNRYCNVIGTAEPCLRIGNGDTVVTDTIDASGLDANEVAVAPRPKTALAAWPVAAEFGFGGLAIGLLLAGVM